jgi:organic hydroperoxide reductase OsmC/OhrA
MMGTFAAVLAKSRIKTSEDLYKAEVRGDIEEVNGIVKITRMNVEYFLKAPPEKHDEAKKAFENYLLLCPAAQSVIGCIDIQHKLNLSNV